MAFIYVMIEALELKKDLIDRNLKDFLSSEGFPPWLEEMLGYPLLEGGKRIRGTFLLWASEAKGKSDPSPLRAACGVECLHAFSLVHDDLPGMDNAPLRRGKPTAHRVYGEGQAILIGDALFSLGMEWIARNLREARVPQTSFILERVSNLMGPKGLVGGQFLDITSKERSPEEWIHLYELKTSCLFQLSLFLGARFARLSPEETAKLEEFGHYFGLAFQLLDDLKDLEADQELNLASLLGAKRALDLSNYWIDEGLKCLQGFSGQKENFISLAEKLRGSDV